MRLLRNELYRFYNNRNTWLITIMLFIITVGYAVLIGFSSSDITNGNTNWRSGIENQIKEDQKQIAILQPSMPMHRFLSEQIIVNQYRLDQDLAPSTKYDVLTLINELRPLTTLITLVAIVFAANAISAEYSKGTIKFVITSPIRRGSFLLLKYISTVINIILLFVTFLIFASLLGYVGLGTGGNNYYLAYQNGEVIKMSMTVYLCLKYLATLLTIIMMATLAFAISVLFRNALLSVSVSLLLYFTGTTLTQFFATKYDWTKYLIFTNYDLSTYLDGTPVIEGMNLSFSVIIMIVYFVAFMGISYLTFTKRDITV
ncbi:MULTISPECIES: ABC transporter permease subunit [Paenibacillus]|jgi:ABC-2 type transport system permease protein|uniref:ABC transporter permease subunit n=1 Tax=Paenibacillus TaxID=44249 RepID=UPI0004F6621D|nr:MULTISPECIES: ABC transporter permease subunit [unclassified Paenibacillus]AIQ27080.1 lantibiotic immunity protein [Paenibacillus sp. FSL P4-0081]OMF29598.1 lantibiotic immunity protein [Paenibacillus sp. FSL H8-0259]